MRPRTLLLAATATVALSALPTVASAAPDVEYVERAAYDSTVETSPASLRVDGATRGELGGYLDVSVTAVDGSLPTGSNVCEPVTVQAVLTLAPGETLSTTVPGDACTSFYGDSTAVDAYFGTKDLTYEGTAHTKVKVVGDGLVGLSHTPWFGGQASVFAAVRW